jgi:hypothetical protein
MEKMPLKVKGMKSSARKTNKKKETGKASTPNTGGKKKATFAKTVGKYTVEEQEIYYKTCVVSLAVQVNKGKDTKGGLDKKIIEGHLLSCKHTSTKMYPSMPFNQTRCSRQSKGNSTCQNIRLP